MLTAPRSAPAPAPLTGLAVFVQKTLGDLGMDPVGVEVGRLSASARRLAQVAVASTDRAAAAFPWLY